MRKTVLITAFLTASALPAFAFDAGCNPASKVSARAPVEAPEKTAEAKATPVTEEMKAETLRTASAPSTTDKKLQ
jgi:hypothetical protein